MPKITRKQLFNHTFPSSLILKQHQREEQKSIRAYTHAQRLSMRGIFIYLFEKNNYTEFVIKTVFPHFLKILFLADIFPTSLIALRFSLSCFSFFCPIFLCGQLSLHPQLPCPVNSGNLCNSCLGVDGIYLSISNQKLYRFLCCGCRPNKAKIVWEALLLDLPQIVFSSLFISFFLLLRFQSFLLPFPSHFYSLYFMPN